MAVKIRLARRGAKKRPFYHIVAADIRAPRDGKYIEKLGTYNPLLSNDDENRVQLEVDAIKKWLGNGAKPTERVAKLLGAAGIIDMPEIPERPLKSKPSQKTLDLREAKAEKAKAAKEAAEEAKAEAKAAAEEEKAEDKAEETAEAPAEEAKAEDKADDTKDDKKEEKAEKKSDDKADDKKEEEAKSDDKADDKKEDEDKKDA